MRALKPYIFATLGATAAVSAMAITGWTRPATIAERSILGDSLPAVRLQKVDGSWQELHERLGGKPAIIYLYSPAECMGCSDVPMEFRVLRREFPAMQPLLIGISAPASRYATPFRDMRLDGDALVDENNTLLKALGVKSEPLVIVVSASGRILFTDTRATRRSSRYPLSRVLRDVQEALGTPAVSRSASQTGR
jgi:peroxiredoxin